MIENPIVIESLSKIRAGEFNSLKNLAKDILLSLNRPVGTVQKMNYQEIILDDVWRRNIKKKRIRFSRVR